MFSYYIKYCIRYSLRYILKYIIRVIIFFGIIYLISFLSGKHLFISDVSAKSYSSLPSSSSACNTAGSCQGLGQITFDYYGYRFVGNQGGNSWINFKYHYSFNNLSKGYYNISGAVYNDGSSFNSIPVTFSISNNNNSYYCSTSSSLSRTSPSLSSGQVGFIDYYTCNDVYISDLSDIQLIVNFSRGFTFNSSGYYGSSRMTLTDVPTDDFVTEQKNTTNAINKTNDSINKTNDTIKDDNVDSSTNQGSSFFNDFNSGDEGSLTDIVSLPLEYVQHLNDSCKPFTIPAGNLGNFTIPCLSSIWSSTSFAGIINTASLIINGIICYKLLSSLFLFFKDLKDPDDDKVEVMNL